MAENQLMDSAEFENLPGDITDALQDACSINRLRQMFAFWFDLSPATKMEG